jgi:tRNA(fMet)-specific endonuclease VapC
MRAYPSRRLSLPDAMIAATAITNNMELWTNNKKDFDFLTGIQFYTPPKIPAKK